MGGHIPFPLIAFARVFCPSKRERNQDNGVSSPV